MSWIGALGCLLLKPLILNDAYSILYYLYGEANWKIAGATDHLEWSVLVYNRQYGYEINLFIIRLEGTDNQHSKTTLHLE